ncbi:hypothetical protein [Cellulomonas sp. RIT-PI-Y]|uniref:CBU_0592 family membrane protein n=1 Tax=Cellulomonas sp. RIT-PI-Y TaxID=3035297 RepID=UPI0021D7F99F|nr:hypothetical protein [Cellulomonas sp. RIT-PI-Y]
MSAVITALGWVGAVTCLIAYVFVTRGKWAPTSGRYQLANVISGLFMGLVAASSGVWPSVLTNLVWMVVGAHAVMVVLRARRQRARDRVPAAAAAVLPTQAGSPALESAPVSLAA